MKARSLNEIKESILNEIKYDSILYNQVIKTTDKQFKYEKLLFCGSIALNGYKKVRIKFSYN